MCKFFFLGSILPPLKIESKPDIVFDDLIELFHKNMNRSDFGKISLIRSYIDLKNVWKFLKKQPLDSRGNYNEKELDEAILNKEGFQNYLFEYFYEYEDLDKQLLYFNKVYIHFFEQMQKEQKGFLKDYFCFEREWRLLLTGYRAKKLGIDPTIELQHEDFTEPFIAQIIAQKDAPFFEFPFGYEDLEERLKDVKNDPKKQYEMMSLFRFNKIADKVQDQPFSIDYILGYFVQHMILTDYYSLEDTKGSQNLTEITKGNDV